MPESTANPGSSPTSRFGRCPSSKHLSPVQETTQEYDDRKSTTERTLSAPGGLFHCPFHLALSHISSCFTVRLTLLFTTLVATRRCRCLLRSDYGELLCLIGLRHVISGILAGGSLVSAWCFCCFTRLLVWPGFYLMFSPLFLLPYHVEMIQCCHLSHELAHELAPVTSWFCGLFCVVVFCFALVGLFFGVFVCGDFVTVHWTALRSCTSSLLKPLNQRTAMCMR